MDLSSLSPAQGSTKNRKRIGRGQGSGRGGTSTRGHKGAKSRSGYSKKLGFEGGQMPLQRRIPKFGFKNANRVEYKAVNLDVLQQLVDKYQVSIVDVPFLQSHGIVGKNDRIKILGRGELTTKVDVSAHAFSKIATQNIEKLGGTVTKL